MASDSNWPTLAGFDDAALMARLAAGERGALAVLVRRHQPKALALAYRFLGRWDAAEDVVQDAFIRVFEAAPRYRPTAAFTTWLYRIVANLCWDRRRQATRAPGQLPDDLPDSAGASAPADGAPDTRLLREERAAQIRAAVARLPDRQRLVLILHRYDGLSHRQIIEITGWSAGAVESCLVRAYEHLRQELAGLIEER